MSRRRARERGIPEGGVSITFHWNDVALARLLDTLEQHYPAGYTDINDKVQRAIALRSTWSVDDDE